MAGTELDGIALIVLAAGRSSRMGAPKALVELAGRPILEHLLAVPLLRNLDDAVVILGHHADEMVPVVEQLGYRYARNPDPDLGRTGSVQVGLRALGQDTRAVFIQPVDCPLIASETYRALMAAVASADVVVPGHGGKPGHPPLVAAAVFPSILAAAPDEPLRNLLRAPAVTRRVVEVDDPGVLVNVDRPEDLDELKSLYRARDRL